MKLKRIALCVLVGLSSFSVDAVNLPYNTIVTTAASKYGYDPLLIHAVIKKESSHNPSAASGVGAQGLMQLMPATARSLGVTNPNDPAQNVNAGTRYLKQLNQQFGNIPHALYAYNWGMGNLRSYLKGKKKVMPKETQDYVPKIAQYYKNYGGSGSYFGSNVVTGGFSGNTPSTKGIENENQKKIQAKLEVQNACKPVKLPEAENVDIDTPVNLPPVPPVTGGAGKVVFDPTKNANAALQVQDLLRQIQVLKGQYDSVTKGLAGLGLLTNVAQIAGFELPNGFDPQPTNIFNNPKEQNAYNDLQRQIATNTGVYASSELSKIQNVTASRVNTAYVDAEVAWTQVNCNMENLKSLAQVSTNTLKQSKDLANAIAIENSMLQANQAKLRSNMLMMQSSMESYKVASHQAVQKYLGTVK
ncbi:lytic transglycosylase domain-containing protein [Acinetobacter sp. Leaf130]|uniref:lytic transglycosylase domain-containing protein n=1 Tax=Acinetobacter sp. Leaf130 TaxID=1736269 RepID=UPI0006F448D8|nr:lytic transglycosylase domain-containing protein [Acinetobacter sp. Leaf130]KQQ65468.1 transglycosylase [Acinetobacter sp. Leaf130]